VRRLQPLGDGGLLRGGAGGAAGATRAVARAQAAGAVGTVRVGADRGDARVRRCHAAAQAVLLDGAALQVAALPDAGAGDVAARVSDPGGGRGAVAGRRKPGAGGGTWTDRRGDRGGGGACDRGGGIPDDLA